MYYNTINLLITNGLTSNINNNADKMTEKQEKSEQGQELTKREWRGKWLINKNYDYICNYY